MLRLPIAKEKQAPATMDRMPPDAESHAGQEEAGQGEQEPPPFLGRWRNLYIVILAWLTFLIFLFYRFTEYFS